MADIVYSEIYFKELAARAVMKTVATTGSILRKKNVPGNEYEEAGISGNLKWTGSNLDTIQSIQTTSSPTFADVILSRIRKSTSDGSDNGVIEILGGGDSGPSRGSGVLISGNEHATYKGMLNLYAGDTADAKIRLYTGNSSLRLDIDKDGLLTHYGDVKYDALTASKLLKLDSSKKVNVLDGTEAPRFGGIGIGSDYISDYIISSFLSTGNALQRYTISGTGGQTAGVVLSTYSSGYYLQMIRHGTGTVGTLFGEALEELSEITASDTSAFILGTVDTSPLILGVDSTNLMEFTSDPKITLHCDIDTDNVYYCKGNMGVSGVFRYDDLYSGSYFIFTIKGGIITDVEATVLAVWTPD